MRRLPLTLAAALLAAPAPAAPPAPVKVTDTVQAVGEVTAEQGVLTAKGPKATLIVGAADADSYRLTAEVRFADKAASVVLQVMPTDPADVSKRAALSGSLYR